MKEGFWNESNRSGSLAVILREVQNLHRSLDAVWDWVMRQVIAESLCEVQSPGWIKEQVLIRARKYSKKYQAFSNAFSSK